MRTEDIGTEVFFLPAAAHVEKDGTFTNTQRLLQWREKAVEPPGDCRPSCGSSTTSAGASARGWPAPAATRDRPLLDLTWDYPTRRARCDEPDAEAVLREINGVGPDDGEPLSSYTELKDDGSTACGCWIYCGVYADGVNQAARRKPGAEQSWVAPEWGWAWPMNRRILYNRASADPEGKPWSERKRYVWWDAEQGWTGHDVPDFEADKAPDYRPPEGARGPRGHGRRRAVHHAGRRQGLAATRPPGLLDGPMPTHYEPHESPVANPLYAPAGQPGPPGVQAHRQPLQPPDGEPGAEVFPYVFTTYRLTEHHTAGGMSRWLPHLAELQPEMFCEVSPELAAERGLEHLGLGHVVTPRSARSRRG